jgi:signal transduction histidine kinase
LPIFDHFDTQGTGIGLAIAKDIVEALDVRICVERASRPGSIFSFPLPASGVRG